MPSRFFSFGVGLEERAIDKMRHESGQRIFFEIMIPLMYFTFFCEFCKPVFFGGKI
jgi:hypothetical protein